MSAPAARPCVLIDLEDTLAYVVQGADGTPPALCPYPGAVEDVAAACVCAQLTPISTGGRSAVGAPVPSALLALFDQGAADLPVVITETHLLDAIARCRPVAYVSAAGQRRQWAARAGLRTAPHPALLAPLLRGERLVHVRVGDLHAPLDVGDGFVTYAGLQCADAVSLYGVAGEGAVARLRQAGCRVEVLDQAASVDHAQVYVLGVSDPPEAGERYLDQLASVALFLHRGDNGAVFALDAGTALPRDGSPASCDVPLVPAHAHRGSGWCGPFAAVAPYSLSRAEIDVLRGLDVALYEKYLAPWRDSAVPPGEASALRSRHVDHGDNRRAVAVALRMLRGIAGLTSVTTECFPDACHMRHVNVVAEIAGDPASPWRHEVVIVSAHLDCVANGSPPATGAAPGMNDDASGIAGVLAAAECLAAMGPPRRTIRFVLFNAEERGMLGSAAYAARHATERTAPIVGAYQLDMIGYRDPEHPYPPGRVELHSGSLSDVLYPGVSDTARELRDMAAVVAAQLFDPRDLEVVAFPSPACPHDWATVKSDHGRLLMHCIPACLVCEDLSMSCASRLSEHPTYHTINDRTVSTRYATDITRIVAGAVWARANAQPVEEIMSTRQPSVSSPSATYVPGLFAAFVSRFLSDPAYRFQVLYREETTMNAVPLDPTQVMAIQNLQVSEIVSALKAEIDAWEAQWGARVEQLRHEVKELASPTCPADAAPAAAAAAPAAAALTTAAMYTEGTTFLLAVSKASVRRGAREVITIKGLGFNQPTWLCFTKCGAEATAPVIVGTATVDVKDDLYQHVRVVVPSSLDEGDWLIYAANEQSDDLQYFKDKTTKWQKITVTA